MKKKEEEVCMSIWSLAEASCFCHVASICSSEELSKEMQHPSGKKSSYHRTCTLFPSQLLAISSFVHLVSLIATLLTFLRIIDTRKVLQVLEALVKIKNVSNFGKLYVWKDRAAIQVHRNKRGCTCRREVSFLLRVIKLNMCLLTLGIKFILIYRWTM